MTKYANISKDIASSTDTTRSNGPSELFNLERDIPTTEEDVRMLRELRSQSAENLVPRIDELMNLRQFENIPSRRTTSEGWEPFELD
jgi:hypothetical protein